MAYRNYSNESKFCFLFNKSDGAGANENMDYPLLNGEGNSRPHSKVYFISRCCTILFCTLILALLIYSLKL